jgi:DNA modification methylase
MKAKILVGDARQRLSEIEFGSVQTCVTSPPYWGLRNYGHNAQIGLEESQEEYVENMVEVFRLVRDTMADNGTLWLNLGDSYGSKKQLSGIPWRVAFALQSDGWFLRQDIIWQKPNAMPESVRDRCTKSHEYLFLLSKSEKYYFDNAAISEPSLGLGTTKIRFGGNKYGDSDDPKHATKSGAVYTDTGTRNRRSVWTINTKPFKGAHFAVMPEELVEPCVLAGSQPTNVVLDPFAGSGTVGVVALRHKRQFVGLELNQEYALMASKRILEDLPLFNEVEML